MKLTVEKVLSDEAIAALYPTYRSACDPLRTKAAARHVLEPEEFGAEMRDPRIDKLVVWDASGHPIALTTLTNDLSAVPWISADYWATRFPNAAARQALYYLGYILVEPTRRRSGALLLMTQAIDERLAQCQGVMGFDICSYNDAQGIGRHVWRLLGSSDRIDSVDVQSYYAADYQRAGADDPELAAAARGPFSTA